MTEKDTTLPISVPYDQMIQHFAFVHLPLRMAAASRPFCALAESVVASLPASAERTVCLRKLLEAKDCAVRAVRVEMLADEADAAAAKVEAEAEAEKAEATS